MQALIRQGAVSVGGKPAAEPNRKLAAGERVAVTMPEPQEPEPQGEPIALDILHEDADIIVINKPAGSSSIPAPATGPARWSTR